MIRAILVPATTTGVFCSFFAFGISQVTSMLTIAQVMSVSFVSGFLGSIFAQMVLGKRK